MNMFVAILVCLCVILTVYLFFQRLKTSRTKKLPGPTPLPIVGNLLQIGFRAHITFTKWAKRYGPIYKIKLGLKDAIVINDHKLIKELFDETATTGRMADNAVVMEFSKGPYGIISSSGSTWVAQRKFTVKTLRNLGFAKASMETLILDEAQNFLNWLKNQVEGCPISGRRIFMAPVITSLWRILSGERYQWEDVRPAILDAVEEFYKEVLNVSCNGLFFVPFLRLVAPNLFGWNRYVQSINKMLKMFQKSIENHKETFNSTELRDYIDHHLFEIGKTTDPKSSFYKDTGNANMIAGLFGLFLGGITTLLVLYLPDTLSWTLLYLSENREIQKSLQMEIKEKIGSTLPSLSNRANMPYCEAVLTEILRITSAAPLTVPHTMMSDLIFHGYYIPKGTSLIANLYAVHYDPEIWGDPGTFRPERFLNEDGTKFVPNEAFIAFGGGKRKCIGDTFVMDTLFLFVTGIFQQFNVTPDPDNKAKADFEPEFGFILGPKPFKVLVTSRKK